MVQRPSPGRASLLEECRLSPPELRQGLAAHFLELLNTSAFLDAIAKGLHGHELAPGRGWALGLHHSKGRNLDTLVMQALQSCSARLATGGTLRLCGGKSPRDCP